MKDVKFDDSILDYEICIITKMERVPCREKRIRAIRRLKILHADTMGPIQRVSHPGGKRLITVFIEDHTRLARAYTMKSKGESGKYLRRFLASTRNLLGKDEEVCYIGSDQGTESTGGQFVDIMKKRYEG